jgi:rhomboid protease GluP
VTPPDASPDLRLIELLRGPARTMPVTWALLAANVAVFVVMLRYGAGLWHTSSAVQLAWGANFGPATQDGEWWRLATAMFLHFGLVHLALNMFALWDVGRLVERLYGSWRFLAIYVGSGLAGNLVSLVIQGNKAVSGGASGAIFGIMGALLVCLAREREHIDPNEFRWLFGGAAVFAAGSLAFGFLVPGIDNAAHVGGLVSGALLGIVYARTLARERAVAPWLRAAAAAVLAAAVVGFVRAIPEPRYRLSEELEAQIAIRQFMADEQRINERWKAILGTSRGTGRTFEDVAGRIDAEVAEKYQDSFDALSSVEVSPDAPSAADLEYLRRYALLRGDAARALAEAMRAKDPVAVRRALDALKRASVEARTASAPTAAASGASAPASQPR